MLEITFHQRLPWSKDKLFCHFENIRSLAARKSELGTLSLRSGKEVLQVADTILNICPFVRYPAECDIPFCQGERLY